MNGELERINEILTQARTEVAKVIIGQKEVIDQVLIIFAGTRGHLDKIPAGEVSQWEKQFLTFMTDQKPEIRQKIQDTNDLDEATMTALSEAIGEFQKQFASQKETETTARV